MPKRKIVTMEEDGEQCTGYIHEWGEIVDEKPVVSLEKLAQLCDEEAESRNNHSYVGTHRLLATLLYQKVGRITATELMYEIAEYGGLDGMAGMGGEPDAYTDLKIKQPWNEWILSD